MPESRRRFLVALLSGLAGAAVTGILMAVDMRERQTCAAPRSWRAEAADARRKSR